ncbi:MAG: hypothetical protein KME52_09900 [Desmonostoc geniculatum HA4340-LM1]|jgi:prophage antirepressor-like protein|nr:hypothetical protein [Desmonostoc geniculatum HA4340-LM1]
MINLSVFNFESHEVRCVGNSASPWFIADDVCKILGIVNNRDAISKLDEDEKLMSLVPTSGQNRQMTVINESGLYSLVLTSRKPQAKRFKKWLTSEVIPAIRKTGRYAIAPQSRKYILAVSPSSVFAIIARYLKQSIEASMVITRGSGKPKASPIRQCLASLVIMLCTLEGIAQMKPSKW